MAHQHFIIPALMLLLCTALIQAQSTSRLHDTCVYSFSVPKAQLPQSSLLGSGCPGMTQLEQEFEGLKARYKLQQEQIAAMMTQLSLVTSECTKLNGDLVRLLILKESINSTNSGSNQIKSSNNNSDSRGQGAVTYIRWGRTVCPAHAQRLYVGYAGGASYHTTGGGANRICLPQAPEWSNKTTDGFQGGAKVYGSEYETHSSNAFSKEHNYGQSLHNHDVLCAACYVPQRSAHIMIPGLVKCPAGWTLEYKGYLVTSNDASQHSVVYECMDEAPEVRIGGETDLNGATLYLVEVECGSLPCSKYVNGWELSCVVCTK